jgi:hypothetical protein
MDIKMWSSGRIVKRKVDALKAFDNNPRRHSQSQIDKLASYIKGNGYFKPVEVDEDNVILSGHGRIEALKQLGVTEVPCIVYKGLTEAQKRSYVVADNRMAELSEWDKESLQQQFTRLDELDVDLQSLGFDEVELEKFTVEDPFDEISNSSKQEIDDEHIAGQQDRINNDNPYSSKIASPIYEPRNEKPEIDKLIDESKTKELKADIEQADIPEYIKKFLNKAADRHTVFNYSLIADFYAHSDKTVQSLMEDSALIIIDFQKAIEKGFVVLAEKMAEVYSNDKQ